MNLFILIIYFILYHNFLEIMNQIMVDRELKMVELKEEIAELKKQPKL